MLVGCGPAVLEIDFERRTFIYLAVYLDLPAQGEYLALHKVKTQTFALYVTMKTLV